MRGFRTVLFKVLFVPVTILWTIFIVCLVVLPFPLRLRLAFGWGYSTIWLARLICGIKWQIHGLEKMPPGACVLMVNHQSTWETRFAEAQNAPGVGAEARADVAAVFRLGAGGAAPDSHQPQEQAAGDAEGD